MPSLRNIPGLNLNMFDVFIFDLDGTLYDQRIVRRKIMISLVSQMIRLRISPRILSIIRTFRHIREEKKAFSSPDLEELQYEWCAKKQKIAPQTVREVIRVWMLQFPLKILPTAIYPGVSDFFLTLGKRYKKIVVYSDYPVEEKLKALGLISDRNYYSLSTRIGQLKPGRKALDLIGSDFGCPAERIIYIGDREDTDGASAHMAGITFLKVDRKEARSGRFYGKLNEQLKALNE